MKRAERAGKLPVAVLTMMAVLTVMGVLTTSMMSTWALPLGTVWTLTIFASGTIALVALWVGTLLPATRR